MWFKKNLREDRTYDLAIAGGGLAGLALSIQVARQGYKVILFEKEQYPFHRVCGEYISLESWDFLEELGVDLSAMDLPEIRKLIVSGINGNSLKQDLPLGGFGISRYTLDFMLAGIARLNNVEVVENCKVNDIQFEDDQFQVETTKGNYSARQVAACYGKRSNLDIKWHRSFAMAKKNKLNNYVGVKYHVAARFPVDTIALHIFPDGYCGISKVEEENYCLCYLTTAANLKKSNNDILRMEQAILSRNPHLRKLFTESTKLWKEPVIISQVSFDRKSQVHDHILMIGDAAGMITPLCGNGMSMALHGSKLAAKQINRFLGLEISRKEMEEQYRKEWKENFSARLQTGRFIQRLFGHRWLIGPLIFLGKVFPGVIRLLIKKTHGKPF
jgi:menaquinone-9 beta-reductase